MGQLTDRKCKTASPGKHPDGDGWRLHVYETGARNWIFRYMLNRRSREMGFKIKASGVDPIEYREKERQRKAQEATTSSTFATCARYIRAHRHGWSNIRHARSWPRSLKTYAGPVIGHNRWTTLAQRTCSPY